MTDYMPKHKRVLRDGMTPRGPARWARAYANLMERPMSHGANLLIDRIVTAAEFRDIYEGPFEHREVWKDYNGTVHNDRKYSTCSPFCAAMVIQLDIDSTSYRDVLGVFEGMYRRTYMVRDARVNASHQPLVLEVDPKTLRSPRCQHCGSTVA